MIIEFADFRSHDPDDFAAAMTELVDTVSSADAYLGHTVQHSIESPNRFMLLIRWKSVEGHNQFRESPAFTQWRERLGPHREGVVVEHFETVLTNGWQLTA